MNDRFLNEKLTAERAKELCDELGFLGLVDLVTFFASRTTGRLECKGPRVTITIKSFIAGERAAAKLARKAVEERP